jgi:hypothetical protein
MFEIFTKPFAAWTLIDVAVLGVLVLVAANIWNLIKYWLDGRKGLNQWPNPHGRYYDEWMKLPKGAGDYHEWLALKMRNRERWRTWVKAEKELQDRSRQGETDAQ